MSHEVRYPRAWTLGQLGYAAPTQVPTRRACPRCGCWISRYTPWTQATCSPCDDYLLGVTPAPVMARALRECAHCQQPMQAVTSQKYCSSRCRSAAQRLREREAPLPPPPPPSPRGECRGCGGTMMYRKPEAIYCSMACKDKAYRTRRAERASVAPTIGELRALIDGDAA